MKKIQRPDTLKKSLAWIFEELETERINPKLLELVKDNNKAKNDTLYNYVNINSVNKLLTEATISYQQLEVN